MRQSVALQFRNALSTAGNSMTSSERPSPKPFLKKEASPAVLGGDNSGNALEASNALNFRAWGIPAVLSRGIPGNALRAFPESFRNFFRKVPAVLGVRPNSVARRDDFGNWSNMVSESTASNTEVSEVLGPHQVPGTEIWREKNR